MPYFNVFVCYCESYSTVNISRFPGDSSFHVAIVKGFLAVHLLRSIENFLPVFSISFSMFPTASPLHFLLPGRFLFSHCNPKWSNGDSSFNLNNISKCLHSVG